MGFHASHVEKTINKEWNKGESSEYIMDLQWSLWKKEMWDNSNNKHKSFFIYENFSLVLYILSMVLIAFDTTNMSGDWYKGGMMFGIEAFIAWIKLILFTFIIPFLWIYLIPWLANICYIWYFFIKDKDNAKILAIFSVLLSLSFIPIFVFWNSIELKLWYFVWVGSFIVLALGTMWMGEVILSWIKKIDIKLRKFGNGEE